MGRGHGKLKGTPAKDVQSFVSEPVRFRWEHRSMYQASRVNGRAHNTARLVPGLYIKAQENMKTSRL